MRAREAVQVADVEWKARHHITQGPKEPNWGSIKTPRCSSVLPALGQDGVAGVTRGPWDCGVWQSLVQNSWLRQALGVGCPWKGTSSRI